MSIKMSGKDSGIFHIFEELHNDNSRIEKEKILTKNKNNNLLKKVISLALDPFTQFYIKKIPDFISDKTPSLTLEEAIDSLSKLSERIYTGHAGINFLKDLLEKLSFDDAKVLIKIIEKDLRAGIQATTVNKIWPNLVFEYPCMLVTQFDLKTVSKIKFPAIVQVKMDGMRFNAIVKKNSVEFRARSGKSLDLLGNLEKEFLSLGESVYDGELLWGESSGESRKLENQLHSQSMYNAYVKEMYGVEMKTETANRQTGNGILSKTIKGTITPKEAAGIKCVLWDVIPVSDFYKGKSEIDYNTRFSTLKEKLSKLETKTWRITLVKSHTVDSLETAQEIYQKYLSEGEEGIILKDLSGIWEDKRTKSQIKFKAELECDLLITEVELGKGRMQNMIGNLICESKDKIITVSVGSGLTDEERVEFLKPKNSIVNKIVSVKYNARITNKEGRQTLFLPIFKEIRYDKTEADLSSNIK